MRQKVLDSSAVLAYLQNEPGAQAVAEVLPESIISAVNMAEVVARLQDGGMPDHWISEVAEAFKDQTLPFGLATALICGRLRATTRDRGLSLGDRACLALALEMGLPVVTADRAWEGLLPTVEVLFIR